MKQFRLILLCVVILMGTLVPGFAFVDTTSHWGSDYIETLAQYGVISGYPDGTFKPDANVSRTEFLVMTMKALGETVRLAKGGEYWGQPYIERALSLGLIQKSDFVSITKTTFDKPILREEMAGVVAAAFLTSNAMPASTSMNAAAAKINDLSEVRACYQQPTLVAYAVKLISGYSDGSFRPSGFATRAESSVVTAKLLSDRLGLGEIASKPAASISAYSVGGISIGDSLEKVTKTLGTPVRKDLSEYGFEWYVYHQNYKNYIQIGIASGRVVGLFTHYGPLESSDGVKMGTTKGAVLERYGASLSKLTKGNVTYLYQKNDEFDLYKLGSGYVTFFYDVHDANKLIAFQMIEKATEEKLLGYFGPASSKLRSAFENQTFDLANVFRVAHGLSTVTYCPISSISAYDHSVDMYTRNFFDHVNPDGLSPFDRMEADGLKFAAASENIAAGYTNAFSTHIGWVNSLGHRVNLLGRDYTRLGVGVAFGGQLHQYFTQDFYKPQS